MKLFHRFDFLSTEAKFTFNKQGDTRIRTVIGGILTIFSVLASFGLSLYFFVLFIFKDNQSVISSNKISPSIELSNSHEMPILFRLSDVNNLPYIDSDRLYKVGLNYWYVDRNSTSNGTKQTYEKVDVEHCDINKHFGNYKDLFKNYTDISTFYCPILRKSNQTIYGIYGNNFPFSYYHFYIYLCVNKEESDDCLPIDDVTQRLSDTYLDLRTIDFSIDNSNNDRVKTANVRTDRFMISISVYKRIWVYLNWIEYITDKGLIFERLKTEYFHQMDSYRYDVDLRDKSTVLVGNTFVSISILSSGKEIIYNRHFQKLQDFIATIGGLIKCISTGAFLLNYYISQNSYYYRLIKAFPFEKRVDTKNSMKTKFSEVNINNNTGQCFTMNNNKLNNKKRTMQRRSTIKMKWYKKLIPIRFAVDSSQMLKYQYEVINETLNIFNLMKIIERHRLIKEDICAKIKHDYMMNQIEKNEGYSFRYTDVKKKDTVLIPLNKLRQNNIKNIYVNESSQNIISKDN